MRNDGAIAISLSQFVKNLLSFKDQWVRIGKKKKEFPPVLVSFHHSIYFAVSLFVGIFLCLISWFFVCLSVCLSVDQPVCFYKGAAKTHLLKRPLPLFSDGSLHSTALICLLARTLRCAHLVARSLTHFWGRGKVNAKCWVMRLLWTIVASCFSLG